MPEQNKPKAMNNDEIQREILAEIKAAEDSPGRGTQVAKRETSWDRYYGRKLGNEKKGRSQFITRDVMDTIEFMMPFFMKTFAAGDPKIEISIKGQESFVGKALMEKIQLDLTEGTPTLFFIFYQWFKDALVSNTAFVKLGWNLDQKTVTADFENLTHENLVRLASDPDVQITKVEEVVGPFAAPTFKATARVKQTIEDTIYAENTPHWEFLVSSKAHDINDEYGKGQKTEVTLDYLKRINRANSTGKEKYFENLDNLEGPDGKSVQPDTLSGEKANYMEGEGDQSVDDYTESETGAKTPVELEEWYTRLDVDGDGYLENIVAWIGNNKLLRHEINEEDFIPFCAIRPIIDCYKFNGIAFAELIIEIQNLKTMLSRRILDMFDFQVSGRWRVDPDGSVDLYALYNHTPGGAISAKQGAIEDISPEPFNPGNLAILEYVDSLKENRTSVTRYNQGMDSNSLNKTATGIMQIQSAAMQRLELVARIFAEGLRDFYRKTAMLYQRYSKPFTAKVHGQEQQITREMLQGKIVCTVNMGIQASVGLEETQKIERMLGILFKVNEAFPGLLTPEKIHNLSRRYITSMGFKQVDDFISDLNEYMQQVQQMQQSQGQAQQAQEQMVEMQQKLEEMEMMIKKQDSDTKAEKVRSDADLEAREQDLDFQVEQDKIDQDERDSARDFKVALANALKPASTSGQ